MDAIELKNKISAVLDTFGMSGQKASEIMNIPYGQFRKKINEIPGRYFVEQNYTDLIDYIKDKAAVLM
jgi:hypothetical protein